MTKAAKKDIIVIGGSTGSSNVLKALLSGLAPETAASIFITTHIPSRSPSMLAEVLDSSAGLPVKQAVDGQPIERGHAYVAAPDRHLLLLGGTIRLAAGPRENMARPSIDPMFRSAALSYGPRVIGVILSGMLNDGAAGLHAIKAAGGTAVVQHPLDAEADEMPLAALGAADVDHVAPAADLATLLTHLTETDAGEPRPVDDALRLEVEIATGAKTGSRTLMRFADPSPLSCPECHGVLSEVKGSRPLRFRCQIGHAYTAEAYGADTTEVDEAIRVALRVMEERLTLVERMATDARQTGRVAVAELYEARAEEFRRYAATLRDAAISAMRASRPVQHQDM